MTRYQVKFTHQTYINEKNFYEFKRLLVEMRMEANQKDILTRAINICFFLTRSKGNVDAEIRQIDTERKLSRFEFLKMKENECFGCFGATWDVKLNFLGEHPGSLK